MKSRTFRKWLKEKYGNRDHRYNDFLQDTVRDGSFPWNKPYIKQAEYLRTKSACEECLETHKDAYIAWIKYQFRSVRDD